MLCGDFNAHTLTMSDVPSEAAEDPVSVSLTNFGITETRANQDLTPDRNSYGKKLLDVCKNHQVYIFNGRLGEDCSIGKPTTTYNTTIDYFLGSPVIML